MNNSSRPKIDFEKILSKGPKSYEMEVGNWWQDQSGNLAHKKAYHQIAKVLRDHVKGARGRRLHILDYACGEGSFLEVLSGYFPNSVFYGIDGSKLMLNVAGRKLENKGLKVVQAEARQNIHLNGQRATLIKTNLPNFNLLKNKMDIVIYLFPNLTCGPGDTGIYNRNGYKNSRDIKVAEMLARFREMDPEDEVDPNDADEEFDDLMSSKVIARNLRGFLKTGGLLLRTEYANAPRHELSQLVQWRSLFAEGALSDPIKGAASDLLFKLVKSEYRKSSVILDVFHQTGDPTDKEGGYYCSLFETA